MTPLIEVAHLSKHYKNLKAVNDLSFTVPAGEVYGKYAAYGLPATVLYTFSTKEY